MNNVAALHLARGDGEDALGTVLAHRATMQSATGDLAGANASLVEALALHERRLGPAHPMTVTTLAKLAALDHVLGRNDDARARWQAVIGARRTPGTPPRELADGLYGFGVYASDVGELGTALEALTEARDILAVLDPRDTLAAARAEYVLRLCLRRMGRGDESRATLTEALSLYAASSAAPPGEVEKVRALLALPR